LEFEIVRPQFDVLPLIALRFFAVNIFKCIEKVLEHASILLGNGMLDNLIFAVFIYIGYITIGAISQARR